MDFDRWFRSTTDRLGKNNSSENLSDNPKSEFYVDGVYLIDFCDPELVDYNTLVDGSYEEIDSWCYPCNCCKDLIYIKDYCCITEFSTENSYCGKSQYCIP